MRKKDLALRGFHGGLREKNAGLGFFCAGLGFFCAEPRENSACQEFFLLWPQQLIYSASERILRVRRRLLERQQMTAAQW